MSTNISRATTGAQRVSNWTKVATVASVLTVVIGGAVIIAFIIHFYASSRLITATAVVLDELAGEQATREVVCIPYVNGVLELGLQGMSGDEIETAYRGSVFRPEIEDSVDLAGLTLVVVDTCGSPAEILAR